jgi:cell division protein FtsA
MHVVTAETPPLRNLELCVNRCHLSIAGMVARPMPAACRSSSTTRPSSAARSSISAAARPPSPSSTAASLVHVDAIAIGGQHITTDIARGLSTRIEDAERLKTMFGSALPGSPTSARCCRCRRSATTTSLPHQVPRSALTRIIKPRVEEILELVRDRLNASGFAGAVRPPAGADRRRQPAQRHGRGGAAGAGAERPPRPAARRLRTAGVRPRAGVRRRVGLLIYPQVAEMEQIERGTRPFRHDRHGRLLRPRRQLDQGKLLSAGGAKKSGRRGGGVREDRTNRAGGTRGRPIRGRRTRMP